MQVDLHHVLRKLLVPQLEQLFHKLAVHLVNFTQAAVLVLPRSEDDLAAALAQKMLAVIQTRHEPHRLMGELAKELHKYLLQKLEDIFIVVADAGRELGQTHKELVSRDLSDEPLHLQVKCVQ